MTIKVAALALLASLLFPGVAFAYSFDHSTDGVLVGREPGDQAATTVIVYYDFMGTGDTYPSSTDVWAAASYRQNRSYSVSSAQWDGIEVALEPGYRVHMIYLNSPTPTRYVVSNDLPHVSVVGTIPVEISNVPTVAVSSEIPWSVEETMPVVVESVNLLAGDSGRVFGVFLGLMAGVGGMLAAKAMRDA